MKVIYISNSRIPSPFANGIQVMKMCEAIANLGHELSLFIRNEKEHIRDDIFSFYGIERAFEIKRTPFKGKAIHALIASTYAKLKKVDLCYTRSVCAAYLTSRLSIPTVFEVHRPFSSRLGRQIAPLLFNSPYLKIVSISNSLAKFYIENYKINSPQKILTKHDGVDLERFTKLSTKEKGRSELNLPQDKKIICYAGNLYRGRGIELLLSVSRELPEDSLILIVGGIEKDLKRYKNIASQTNCTNVYFTGFVPTGIVSMYLAASDVLVMPYKRNAEDATGCIIGDFTSPLKMFEYMASGRPIIASNLSVIREVLKDRENALLFDPEDEKALLSAIKTALEDKEVAQKIAMNAQNEAKNYTWTERVRAILSFSLDKD